MVICHMRMIQMIKLLTDVICNDSRLADDHVQSEIRRCAHFGEQSRHLGTAHVLVHALAGLKTYCLCYSLSFVSML